MLISNLIRSCLRPGRVGRETHAAAGETRIGNVQDLAGFNKLVRARHGIFVANENDVYIGRALIAYGEFCELEWSLLRRYCRPGNTVVEVGANIGGHTVAIARAVGAAGRVVAIEPQPIVFQALCANLALNCLLNVTALNCACADSVRALALPAVDYGKEGNFGGVALRPPSAEPSMTVRCEPLDDLLRDFAQVDFIKIDVEGMERHVLAGSTRVIDRFRPMLYVENDRQGNSKSLIDMLQSLGYRAWWHIPPLFNSDNYYANAHDLYPGICSFNMLCAPSDREAGIPEGLREARATDPHPLSGAA